jgi:transcriptional regulator with XRE-family HTH domain
VIDRESFCQQLRQAREASGMTLEAIAEASKIQTSLLAGLERGDLSRWPSGIYRRSFVREYAAAIRLLHAEQVVSDFVRLFPDDVTVPGAYAAAPHDGPGANRLTLALDSQWLIVPTRAGTQAAIVDLLLVLLMGRLGFLLAGDFWAVTAVVALVYYSLATACGTTFGSYWFTSRPYLRWRTLFGRTAEPTAVDRPRLVFRRLEQPAPGSPVLNPLHDLGEPIDIETESTVEQNWRAASN